MNIRLLFKIGKHSTHLTSMIYTPKTNKNFNRLIKVISYECNFKKFYDNKNNKTGNRLR